ncbi:hypothetical protein [Nitrosopumilus sp.]|uniref:hypothetical protein n=1 Tax=Nitrosopumilus sp. TaxID=2024843 RepID=UPI0026044154|nr:hypothetical protein [Nitrosopumilus sp.]
MNNGITIGIIIFAIIVIGVSGYSILQTPENTPNLDTINESSPSSDEPKQGRELTVDLNENLGLEGN